nr:MAG TPA: hypothetical protein [Caudoviricetes sp.]
MTYSGLLVNVIHCHVPSSFGLSELLLSATKGSPLYTYCLSVGFP